jgi:tetratricopeptide (TPR) repeat protein
MTSGTEESVQAMPLVNYARALFDLGRLAEAVDYAERGVAQAKQRGDDAPLRDGLLLLAGIYRAKGDLDRAASVASEAAARFERTLSPGHVAFAGLAMQRALNAKAAGDLRTALDFSNQAVAIAESAGNTRGGQRLVGFLLHRSDIALQFGRSDDARADAERALGILQSVPEPETPSGNYGRAYLALGRALQSRGKYGEARVVFRAAAEHLRNAFGPDHPDTRSAEDQASRRSQTKS